MHHLKGAFNISHRITCRFLCLRLGNTGWILNWTTNSSEVPYAMSFSFGTGSTYSKRHILQLNIPEVGEAHLCYHFCPCASRELHQSKLSFLKLCLTLSKEMFSSITWAGTKSKGLALPSVSGRENSLQISILLWRKLLKTPEISTTSQRLKTRFRDIVYMLPKLHSLYLFPMIVKRDLLHLLRKVWIRDWRKDRTSDRSWLILILINKSSSVIPCHFTLHDISNYNNI